MSWLKDRAPTIGALTGAVVAVVAILQLAVVGPMNRHFDTMNQRFGDMNQRFDELRSDINQRFGDVNRRFEELRADMNARFDAQGKYMNARFDAVDQRLDRLENGVSELRSLGDRVSRNEGRIDLVTEQLRTAPTPSP